MEVFLGINYVVAINKLPTITSYWECKYYIEKEDIKDGKTRIRFKDILQYLNFSSNTVVINIAKLHHQHGLTP